MKVKLFMRMLFNIKGTITISVAKDVIHKLDRFKEEAPKVADKEKPSHGDVVRLIILNLQSEDFQGLTPLFYSHVNPYGRLVLDMNERIIIEE